MKLYFQNANGIEKFICEVENKEQAFSKIKDFCYERSFNIPYFRTWGDLDKNGINFDVGSHVEFFVMRKE